MAQEVKRCKQCGLLKDVEDFRPYTYSRTNNTKGRYSVCRGCESINATYRRAQRDLSLAAYKSDAWEKQRTTLDDIDALYDVLEARGLHTPRQRSNAAPMDAVQQSIKQLTEFYQVKPNGDSRGVVGTQPGVPTDLPSDLTHWLEDDPDVWMQKGLSPEYLQETVYESLKAKYRPQIGVDPDTYLPKYDDTYKQALNQILQRFDDYEEACSATEEAESYYDM